MTTLTTFPITGNRPSEMAPASSITGADTLTVTQSGVTRRGTVTQLLAAGVTQATIDAAIAAHVAAGGHDARYVRTVNSVGPDGSGNVVVAGGGATNLAIGTVNATTVQVTSDTGTDATIPAATASAAGVATAAQITKLDGLPDAAGLVALIDSSIATSGAGATREITGAATIITADVTGATIRFNSASTAVLTIPSDAALAIVAGKAQLAVFVQGAGVPTFAGSGATLLGAPRAGLAQNDTIVLNHTGIANTWSYA